MLILFWIVLFTYVLRLFSLKYGIPYLFLFPEYLGKVNFLSHLILGFAFGGFIMAFNIASYILNGFRFPFIATLNRPFLKYCYNNFILPALFMFTYGFALFHFQRQVEYLNTGEVLMNLFGLCLGTFIFIAISLLYFRFTNKNLIRLFGIDPEKHDRQTSGKAAEKRRRRKKDEPVKGFFIRNQHWYKIFTREREWRIHSYLITPLRIGLARDSRHYSRHMLQSVFRQNHMNASVFEVLVIISILFLGAFREQHWCQLPAGVSILLLFTMFLMLTSALHSWLKGWSTTVGIVLLIVLNLLSRYDTLQYKSYAYGVDYSSTAPYPGVMPDSISIDADLINEQNILEKWKHNNSVSDTSKPLLVLLNCSGGGLRSAMWTAIVLQKLDSITNGGFMKKAHLISGASGGIIGAAYMREVFLRTGHLKGHENLDNISGDLLNSTALTLAVNDLFIRWQSFKIGNNRYIKDRGYSFEQQLNNNTQGILNKSIGDYQAPEAEARIPLLFINPTVINDGRRIIISPQGTSYLQQRFVHQSLYPALHDNLSFKQMFDEQGGMNLKLTSALRMGATFPYITPTVTLPTNPEIQVMDAGVRDNTGLEMSVSYLLALHEWINNNTSGVLILQILDKARSFKTPPLRNTLVEELFNPVGSFYTNWAHIQHFDHSELLCLTKEQLNVPLHVLSFELIKDRDEPISLSWHLTAREKSRIYQTIKNEHNKRVLMDTYELLKQQADIKNK